MTPTRAIGALLALVTVGSGASAQEPTKQAEPPKEGAPQEPAGREQALDRALQQALEEPAATLPPQAATPPLFSTTPQMRLIDVSLDGLFALGTSTETDEGLETLEAGGHDPRKRGVTVQNVEVSLMGAVDPYFTAEAHIIYFIDPISGDSEFELEEAFATTQQLPADLQLKIGQFFSEFGRINPQHPHQWDWQDAPVINTRLFGADGMRGPGVRLSWLTPLPWYSDLAVSVQNANGETMSSFLANDEVFEERPVGGRPFVDRDVHSLEDLVYLVRTANTFDLSETTSGVFGLSAAYGPNATGPDAQTLIYGADLVTKWRPESSFRGWPFVVWQSEIMARRYQADQALVENDPTTNADDVLEPQQTLDDWGLYTQVLWGFEYGWAAGMRYDYATSHEPSFDDTGAVLGDDPFREGRHRFSPLVVWHASEFSRVRLQYNYDHAEHLQGHGAHSVWLGFEFMIGAHAAHKY